MLPAATNDQDLNTISEAGKPQGASATGATGMSLYSSDGTGDTSPSTDHPAAADDSHTADVSKSGDDSRAADWPRQADTAQHAVLEEAGWGDKFRFAADDAPTGDWSRSASTAQHADLTQQKQG